MLADLTKRVKEMLDSCKRSTCRKWDLGLGHDSLFMRETSRWCLDKASDERWHGEKYSTRVMCLFIFL